MKTITFDCPDEVEAQLKRLVDSGWEDSPQEAMVEALRRYLRLREPAILERHLKSDIAWGLHGRA